MQCCRKRRDGQSLWLEHWESPTSKRSCGKKGTNPKYIGVLKAVCSRFLSKAPHKDGLNGVVEMMQGVSSFPNSVQLRKFDVPRR
jgi:hypothetical protein